MDEKEHSRTFRLVRNWSAGTLIAAIMAFFPINKAYVDYHVGLARDIVTEAVAPIQKSQQQTSDKLDFLVKAESARLVDDLKSQLVILRLQEQTPMTLRAIAELEQRIDRAEAYRDCVFDEKPNCDALRVFQ